MSLLVRCLGCLSVVLSLISVAVGMAVKLNLPQAQHGLSMAAVHKECNGTHNGLSFTGSSLYHYRRMEARYSGCTHVNGNLEITILDGKSIDYDLSFLRDIRYVSGYVVICLVTEVAEIPLHSLQVIRGNSTFSYANRTGYGLSVLLTYPYGNKTAGLKQLQLPSLKEITNGKVAFQSNPSLGFVETIDWDAIVRHRPNAVDFFVEPYNASVSRTVVRSGCPSGRMWGMGFCQSDVPDIQCHSSCDGRCFGPGSGECCHATCAVGCHGPTNQDCMLCKDYEYNSGCVGFCPAGTNPNAQTCVPY